MTDQLNSKTSDGVEAPVAAGEGVHAVGDRREMMKKFGRFAAYTAPAMIALYNVKSAQAAHSGSIPSFPKPPVGRFPF